MGLFDSLLNRESEDEITYRVENGECAKLFRDIICEFFQEGNDRYAWLMANSEERMFKLEFFKNGVKMTHIEVNQTRFRKTGTFDVKVETWGFGASGYEDLPNGRYVYAFRRFILNGITERCPTVEIRDSNGDYIALKRGVKKGW